MPEIPDRPPVPVRFPDGVEQLIPWTTWEGMRQVAEVEGLTVDGWLARHLPAVMAEVNPSGRSSLGIDPNPPRALPGRA